MNDTAMIHTTTIPPAASPGGPQVRAARRAAGPRRAPAVVALAMAAGVALSGCSGGGETGSTTSPTTQVTTSSSSTPVSTPPATETAAAISAPTSPAASVAPVAPAPPAPLPANVVGTGGPCQLLGEVAQADDGSPLFCTEDPGGAGPLWLPQPGAGPDGTGPALLGRPCMQEGVAVTTPDGAVLTCRLTGGGDVPGGLYWQ